MAVAGTEINKTENMTDAPRCGATLSSKSNGLQWAEIWKYAKEMARPAEAYSIGEGVLSDQPTPCWEPGVMESCAILCQKGIDNRKILEEITPMAVHAASNANKAWAGKPLPD